MEEPNVIVKDLKTGRLEQMPFLYALFRWKIKKDVDISEDCDVLPRFTGENNFKQMVNTIIKAINEEAEASPSEELKNMINEKHQAKETEYLQIREAVKGLTRPILDAIFELANQYRVRDGYARAPFKDDICVKVESSFRQRGEIPPKREYTERALRLLVSPDCECEHNCKHELKHGNSQKVLDCADNNCSCCDTQGLLFSPSSGRYYPSSSGLAKLKESKDDQKVEESLV